MTGRTIVPGLCMLLVLILPGGAGPAAGQGEGGGPAVSPEQAMMEAWAKASRPGEAHQRLAEMAGSWEVTAKFWGQPGAEPLVSQGLAERRMILDGRVLEERYRGEFMETPFEGYGLTGYDNLQGEYWGTWTDSMSTALMISEGQCTETGEICTFLGSFEDAAIGRTVHTKTVLRHEGTDKQLVESYAIAPDGREHKVMELVYVRREEE